MMSPEEMRSSRSFVVPEEDNRIVITDPCYERDSPNLNIVHPAAPGRWKGVVSREKGLTVSLTVYHEGTFSDDDDARAACEKELDKVSVDSGLMGVFVFSRYPLGESDYDDEKSFYRRICDAMNGTDEEERRRVDLKVTAAGIDDVGFFSHSGDGDGRYKVIASLNSDGQMDAVCVLFSEEDEEEDEEECEELEEEDSDEEAVASFDDKDSGHA